MNQSQSRLMDASGVLDDSYLVMSAYMDNLLDTTKRNDPNDSFLQNLNSSISEIGQKS